MAYDKNLKEGIILQIGEFGESGKLLKILTNEGVKNLVATGVRELKSKMRNSIDVLSYVDFEYVEGKEVMRLVGIFPKDKLMTFSGENIIQKRRVISNVVNFILKSVVGETENDNLFEVFQDGVEKLGQENFGFQSFELKTDAENLKNTFEVFEMLWLVGILSSLGYWEKGNMDSIDFKNFSTFLENKKKISEEINLALRNTHLLN